MTAASMLAEVRKHIGLGEPNFVQAWYAARNGAAYLGNVAWCDELITYCAVVSGNAAAVLPAGLDRAYTVWHAEDFERAGRWHAGTTANLKKAQPGDIVFFDWGLTDHVGAIDHVGIIEVVLGDGRVQTIEGNTGDACRRRVRGAAEIVGYGRPAYTAATPYRWNGKAPTGPLRAGDTGDRVRDLQHALMAAGLRLPTYGADGDYGTETAAAVRSLQAKAGLKTTGVYDPATAAALARDLDPQKEEVEDVRYYGQLATGAGAVTPISLHPGDVGAIGFICDNGIAKKPPVKLRVAVHDKQGWYAREIEVDSAKPKPWFDFRDPKTTDGISVRRDDDGSVPVAWDAS